MSAASLLRDYHFRSLTESTEIYGVAGNPVAHSVSPAMHNAAFRAAGLDVSLGEAAEDDQATLGKVLESIFRKGDLKSNPGGEAPRHCILQGILGHKQGIVPHLRQYFEKDCQVQMVPFLMDVRGWLQLELVLQRWAVELTTGTLPALEKRQALEDLLNA